MTMTDTFLFTGLGVGFSIAVPIGPMGLLCIQRTLTSGMRVGVCTGLGAATVNVFYGLIVILGFSSLAPILVNAGRLLNLVGGLFLLWSALRTFRRGRERSMNSPFTATIMSPGMAYGSAVAFNVTNPMAPMLILALLSPILGTGAPSCAQTANLLAGIFLAASCWWVCLTSGVSVLRIHLNPGMLMIVNRIASALLTLYAAIALSRFARL